MFARSRPVALVGGRILSADGVVSSIRFSSRVLGLDEPPRDGDEVVELDGAVVLPGLINAHDHLELNHYGRLKRRERYDNASQWIDDLRPALREDEAIRRNSAYALRDRLFIGGLKNIVSGVTTVAHHNPVYHEMAGRVPVRVVHPMGWAHSLGMEDEPVGAHGEPGPRVREAFRATPPSVPFVVHAAEGTDDEAASEIARLDALGCLASNTVVVHGVGITPSAWVRMGAVGASLVWCPESNLFLLGETVPVRRFLDAAPDAWTRVCLGTDSRVTGTRDLLDELRVAARVQPLTACELLRMVTVAAARVLKLPNVGEIALGKPADLVVVPPANGDPGEALLAARRNTVLLVVVGGHPSIGAHRFARVFRARQLKSAPIVIDEAERLAEGRFARLIARCPIREPGVTAA